MYRRAIQVVDFLVHHRSSRLAGLLLLTVAFNGNTSSTGMLRMISSLSGSDFDSLASDEDSFSSESSSSESLLFFFSSLSYS